MKRALIAAGVIGLLPALTLPAYFRDMKHAHRRQQQFGSQVIQTEKGLVEYATAGEGESVLVVHGAGTGYDQGIVTGLASLGKDYHIIAPSRFGYQRTPLPKDASAAAQADALASFLDTLSISRIPVIATSAGAPSCLQLALRHPKRVLSLVLLVPGVYSPQPARNKQSVSLGFILSSLLKSNYPLWVASKLNPEKVLATIGIPPTIQQQLTAAKKDDLLNWLFPYNNRIAGMMNDAIVENNLKPLPLHRITTPTLIFSAKDDLWNTFVPSQYTAAHITSATFIGYETGGHLLIGHEGSVQAEIRAFLRAHTLQPATT